MNKVRRNMIADIQSKLAEIREMIEDVMNEEQEAFDNMPESLQYSDRGEAMEEAIDALDSALGSVDEIDEYLSDASDK